MWLHLQHHSSGLTLKEPCLKITSRFWAPSLLDIRFCACQKFSGNHLGPRLWRPVLHGRPYMSELDAAFLSLSFKFLVSSLHDGYTLGSLSSESVFLFLPSFPYIIPCASVWISSRRLLALEVLDHTHAIPSQKMVKLRDQDKTSHMRVKSCNTSTKNIWLFCNMIQLEPGDGGARL